jgi:hypothetical protein
VQVLSFGAGVSTDYFRGARCCGDKLIDYGSESCSLSSECFFPEYLVSSSFWDESACDLCAAGLVDALSATTSSSSVRLY